MTATLAIGPTPPSHQHTSNLSFSHQLAADNSPTPSTNMFAPAMAPSDPSRQTSMSSSTPRHLPLDDPSTSDKENSPAAAYIARSASNLCHPTIAAEQSISFTPQRVKPPPRAWERRPATPYVLRNEHQKIWKRVPLGELGIGRGGDNNARAAGELKPERDAKADYVRVVKRLKLDGEGTGSEDGSGTVVVGNAIALGTKVEMDQIEVMGSPKKKQRNVTVVDTPRSDEGDIEGDNESQIEVDIATEHTSGEELINSDMSNALEEGRPGALGDSDELVESTCASRADTNTDTAAEIYETNPEVARDEQVCVDAVGPTKCEAPMTALAATEENDQDRARISEDINITNSELEEQTSADESCRTIPSTITSQTAQTESNGASIDSDAITRVVESSPTSVFAHVDTPSSDTTDEPNAAEPMTIFSGTDQAETAFLHEFLLRAKASKAARDVAGQLSRATPSQENAQAVSNVESTPNDVLLDDDVEDLDPASPIKRSITAQIDTELDMKPSSPVRRSARAVQKANTTLPRPPNLPPVPQFGPVLPSQNFPVPNTIQLRRATGTEFIFNAKAQQTLAMTTRANTKRNQGPAIHVTERLAQLRSEGLAVEEGQATATVDNSSTASPSKKAGSRKRKIAKSHNNSKVKKSVQWNEVLTSFREPTPLSPESQPTSKEFADIEAAAQAEALESMTDSFIFPAITTPDPFVEPTTASNQEPTSTALLDTKASQDIYTAATSSSSSKLKVRNLRRINVGSVNGTPAPKKTRSQSLRYHQQPQQTDQISQTTTQQSSIPKPAASAASKSSVPIPSTSGLASAGRPLTSSETKSSATISTGLTGRRTLRGTNGIFRPR